MNRQWYSRAWLLVGAWMSVFLPLQGQPYQKVFLYLGEDEYMKQAAVLDSGRAVVGLGYVTDDIRVPLLVRYDLAGQPLWQRAPVDGPVDRYHWECLGTEGDGIFVGGLADGDSSSAAIHRFDLNGTATWARIFSYYDDRMSITALAGDHNGNLAFGGQVADELYTPDGMVGKIRASDGQALWMSTIDDTFDIRVQAVTTTPSGEVIAAGNLRRMPGPVILRTWMAKWSAQGTLLWCKQLDYGAVVHAIKADAHAIYLAGDDYNNWSYDWAFVGKFTQSGALINWKAMVNPDQYSFVKDMKLDADGLALAVAHLELSTNRWTGLIMRMDTALQPLYTWKDEFVMPNAVAGTDAAGMVHFLSTYYTAPSNNAVIAHSAIPDAPSSAIPCGMVPYAPVFVSGAPVVLDYAVSTGSLHRSGFGSTNTYPPLLIPVTDCIGTGTEAPRYSLEAWPNPTTGLLHLRLPDEATEITLMSIDGREVLRTTGSGETGIDLAEIPQGVYLLKATTASGVWTSKVMRMN